MPIIARLQGCLFKFIQKQPQTPEVFIIGSQLTISSDLCRCNVRELKECSQKFRTNCKIHKEKTCVRVFFTNFIKKRNFGTCFSVNFAKFIELLFHSTPLFTLQSWRLLLLFIDLSLTYFSPLSSYRQATIGNLYSLSLFYFLTNFYYSCSYLSSLLFLLPKTKFVSSFAFVL